MDDRLREWLGALGRAGWTTKRYGRLASEPELVAVEFRYRSCTDVVIFADHDAAVGYRTPSPDAEAPEYVTYIVSGRLHDVVIAVIQWPDPAEETTTPALMFPPIGAGVPEALRAGPVWVRPSRWTRPAITPVPVESCPS